MEIVSYTPPKISKNTYNDITNFMNNNYKKLYNNIYFKILKDLYKYKKDV